MYKKEYYLVYTTNSDSTFQISSIQITQEELDSVNSMIQNIENHKNLMHYLTMFIWCYEDIKNLFEPFLQDHTEILKSGVLPQPEHFEINGRDFYLSLNSEIIKILTFADIYLDHLETFIKKNYDNKALTYFKKLIQDWYNKSFSYRFCSELKNYSIHSALPLEFIKIVKSPINVNDTEYELRYLVGMNASIVSSQNPIIHHDSEQDEDHPKAGEGKSEEYDYRLVVSKERLINSSFGWKRNLDQEIAAQDEFIEITDHLFNYTKAIIEINDMSAKYFLNTLSENVDYIFSIIRQLDLRNDINEVYVKTVLVDENTGEIIPNEEPFSSLGLASLLDRSGG